MNMIGKWATGMVWLAAGLLSTGVAAAGTNASWVGLLESNEPATSATFAAAVMPLFKAYADRYGTASCGEMARNSAGQYALAWRTAPASTGCAVSPVAVPHGFVATGWVLRWLPQSHADSALPGWTWRPDGVDVCLAGTPPASLWFVPASSMTLAPPRFPVLFWQPSRACPMIAHNTMKKQGCFAPQVRLCSQMEQRAPAK